MSLTPPPFEQDIFINYSHKDNEPPVPNHDGWVDTFHRSLLVRLEQLFGKKPVIWQDKQMRGNEGLPDTICVALGQTAFLVSVLSPLYVNSDWCKRELNEFYKRAAENGGIKLNNRSRIFKVVKTPIVDDPRIDPFEGSNLSRDLRRILQDSLGYEFYEFHSVSGKLREFWPQHTDDRLMKFLEKLGDLALDIKHFIEVQQSLTGDLRRPKTVFLAETTPDLVDDRSEIKRLLQQHGFRVLPDEDLPFDEGRFEEKVVSCLENSNLSVHLIGADRSAHPSDDAQLDRLNLRYGLAAERAIRQHELAMDRGDSGESFFRFIWMPDDLKAYDVSYQNFLAYLRDDPAVYEDADVLCGSKLENFKTIIRKKLKIHDEERARADGSKKIYLMCDKQDLEATSDLRTYLENELHFEVLLPFKATADVVSGHKENLRLCDALLIFYGATDAIDYKLRDLQRIDVIRDGKPLLGKGVYVKGPETESKRNFQTDKALVMKDFGEFAPNSIRPFVEAIERAEKMQSSNAAAV